MAEDCSYLCIVGLSNNFLFSLTSLSHFKFPTISTNSTQFTPSRNFAFLFPTSFFPILHLSCSTSFTVLGQVCNLTGQWISTRLSNNKILRKFSSQIDVLRSVRKKTDKELSPQQRHHSVTKPPPSASLGVHTYTRLSTESFSFIECRHFFQLDTAECTYNL